MHTCWLSMPRFSDSTLFHLGLGNNSSINEWLVKLLHYEREVVLWILDQIKVHHMETEIIRLKLDYFLGTSVYFLDKMHMVSLEREREEEGEETPAERFELAQYFPTNETCLSDLIISNSALVLFSYIYTLYNV